LASGLAGELLLILARQREIVVMCKKPDQRTKLERYQVGRGLRRSLLLEVGLFVPVSVVLMLLIVRPLLLDKTVVKSLATNYPLSFCALLGTISYGFPFAALRRFVTKVALETLKKFAEVTIQSAESDIKKEQQDEELGTQAGQDAESGAKGEDLKDNGDDKVQKEP